MAGELDAEDAFGSSPAPSAARCILVVGMHRSGTSAVTRTLHEMGAAMHDNLLQPMPENPEGFWESADIVAIHDQFLTAIGSSWDDPRAFPLGAFESRAATTCRAGLRDVLNSDFAHTPLFAVKDPRICRLLPIWLPMLAEVAIQPFIVLPVRNPMEVALSLGKRNAMAREHALLLWLVHTLAAERQSRGVARAFVSYDGFIADPRATAAGLLGAIGCFAPADVAAGLERIGGQWSAALRHHAVADDAQTPPWVGAAWRWFVAAAAGDEPPASGLDRIAERLAEAQGLYDPLLSADLAHPPMRRDLLTRVLRRLGVH